MQGVAAKNDASYDLSRAGASVTGQTTIAASAATTSLPNGRIVTVSGLLSCDCLRARGRGAAVAALEREVRFCGGAAHPPRVTRSPASGSKTRGVSQLSSGSGESRFEPRRGNSIASRHLGGVGRSRFRGEVPFLSSVLSCASCRVHQTSGGRRETLSREREVTYTA
jgi:hypothetical protein